MDVARPMRPDGSREERFEALYVQQYSSIYAYAHRRLAGMGVDVHGVVADVFAVAWRRLDDVPAAPEDRLWLFGVARRRVSRARRSGWRWHRLQARLSEEARVRANGNIEAGTATVISAAIDGLRPLDREVLQLVMWEGLTHAEAGQVLGCSPNAVALRLHKARLRLRSVLEDTDDADSTADFRPGASQ